MKRLMRRIHLDNKGFTMMELLIVVAIIGVLAAVAVPNVIRFIGRGQEEAARAELVTIQAAMDAAMVDEGLATVDNKTGVTDFSGDAIATGVYLYPGFLRVRFAGAVTSAGDNATYSWDATGKVRSTAICPTTGAWVSP